jgi:hypothetical protein
MQIEADMMLASLAGMQNGQLVIIGAGWMVRAPRAPAGGPMAIAAVVRVPRDAFGKHQLRLELLDSDDQIVMINPPDGPGPMIIETEFDASGLPDLSTPVTVPIAINLAPFPLARGQAYRWRAYIDGETRDRRLLRRRSSGVVLRLDQGPSLGRHEAIDELREGF